MNSALLDTSFLISLSDPARKHHEAARLYFRGCIDRRVPMYLSSIVVSEYQVKQAINLRTAVAATQLADSSALARVCCDV